MIPVEHDEDTGHGVEYEYSSHPFMRGIMGFDDYNYTVYNPYVLVGDPKEMEQSSPEKKIKPDV